jgi:hypothetical protein
MLKSNCFIAPDVLTQQNLSKHLPMFAITLFEVHPPVLHAPFSHGDLEAAEDDRGTVWLSMLCA